jgi:hypothetical protein
LVALDRRRRWRAGSARGAANWPPMTVRATREWATVRPVDGVRARIGHVLATVIALRAQWL